MATEEAMRQSRAILFTTNQCFGGISQSSNESYDSLTPSNAITSSDVER